MEGLGSGYYRDIVTGSTVGDPTSVVPPSAVKPTKSSESSFTPCGVCDVVLIPGTASALDVEFGEDDGAHLLYQSTRSDSTGIERHGLWYAHGLIEQSSWTFKKAVGDEASLAVMKVQIIKGEERITAAWREGEGLALTHICRAAATDTVDRRSRCIIQSQTHTLLTSQP